MIRFRLRNRLHRVDHIRGATIQFMTPGTNAVVASATTNAHGVASLHTGALGAGTFSCVATAPHTSSDPVGPALASAAHPPDRIYRPVTLTVRLTAAGVATATPLNPQNAAVAINGNLVTVDVQPVWMRSAVHSTRGQSISMIVVHHTACELGPAVSTFLSEKGPHYMIDTDGQVVKWVQDVRSAAHAGQSRWAGHSHINSRSIGIEIVNKTGPYPQAQYDALLALLDRIRAAFPHIPASSIVGHSDIGTNSSGRLGRKSGDPGMQFEWSRLESRRLGLLIAAGPPSLTIYGGFFAASPNGSLRRGDNDGHHRFGGSTHTGVTGNIVRELQQDLAAIGYSVGTPDGDFGEKSHYAVIALQEHFFAGGRGHKRPDGRVDFQTAALIKSVAAATPATTSAAPGAAGGTAAGGSGTH